jgi:CBS domain-containing protein
MSKTPIAENAFLADDTNQWYEKTVEELGIHTREERLTCARPNHKVSRIIELMYDPENDEFPMFRHILVTDDGTAGKEIKGIVSLRDINRHLSGVESGKDPLEAIMTRFKENKEEFHFVHNNSPFREALHCLLLGGRPIYVSAVPVLQSNSYSAVGIMSYTDIIKAMKKGIIKTPDRSVKDIMQPRNDAGKRFHMFAPDGKGDENDDTFSEVASLLKTTMYRTVPVVTKDFLLQGIITDNKIYITRGRYKPLLETMKVNDKLIMYPKNGTDRLGRKYFEFITPDQRISEVLSAFETIIRPDALMVVSSDRVHEMVGILSYVDIFRALFESIPNVK